MIRLFISAILCSLAIPALAQSIYTEYGKNRLQYHDDFKDWWMYETENFVTYWYGKGRNIAQAVVQFAEHDNNEIQNVLEHRFNDKIEIVVYVDVTDMKQSNIGAEEIFSSRAGRTKILGNKMFVYFDGDHQHLRQQIRQGIGAVYLESMLYGSNLQEVVQNAVLLNLPDWYKDGLISYVAEGWTPSYDNQMIDYMQLRKGKYRDFYRFSRENPTLAGHSMWYFISQTYGRSVIANILYLTRINRNLDNAILYVLGVKFDELVEAWEAFVMERYVEDGRWDGEDLLDLPKRKHGARISAMSVSPDGNSLAYALNEFNKTRVFLYDIRSGTRMRLMSYGTKNILQEADFQYPLFAWRRDRKALTVLYEKRDVPQFMHFDLETNEVSRALLSPEFQRVYSMDYWHPDTLVMAASTNGFSDLFKYTPLTRQSFRITEDFYDDLDVRVMELRGKKGIVFSSNRLSNSLEKRLLRMELPLENFDLYFMYPGKENWAVLNLTQTPRISEKQPVAGETLDEVATLSHESGLVSRKVIQIHDAPSESLAFSDPRVVTHHTSAKGETYIAFVAGGFQRVIKAESELTDDALFDSQYQGLNNNREQKASKRDSLDFADPRYLFYSPFRKPDSLRIKQSEPEPDMPEEPELTEEILETVTADSTKPLNYRPDKVVEFRPVRAIAHRLRFKLDYVTTTVDNSLLFTTLDNYAGTNQQFEQPPLGILLKANLKDLFEDYVIEGGARFPTSFNGSEYFLYLDDNKKRFDKRYAFYRKTSTNTITSGPLDIDRTQTVTVIGQYRLSYPFDTYTSLRGTLTLRNDRVNLMATDISNLNTRIDDNQRIGLKLEYVYDNTVEWEVNSRHGTRAKVWTEVVKKFDLNLFEPGQALTFNEGFMTVFGVDARHYQPLDRHSVLATRLMATTSVGSERILYYLGGVENWLFSKYDNTIPVPSDENFAYQSIAANMRGFNYNARNGSSVILLNTEVRVPFVRYLSRGKVRSAFLRNLQIVGFADIGTAWHGSDPFGDDNPLNTLTLVSPPTVQVDVKYFRNPVIFGYGAGFRAMLFGYYFKLDYAWGIDTGRTMDPKLHFSLGLDF